MNRHLRRLFCILVFVVPVTSSNSVAIGQETETPQRTVLEVSPAKVPDPPLKYRLLPGYGERKPGNAAVYYGKVTAEQTRAYGFAGDYYIGMMALQELSPREQMASPDLSNYANTPGYYMLRAGALCDDCDWQIPIRDQNMIDVLLPEVQQTRKFQRYMSFQTIAQIRDKDTAGAIETLQTGFALAHNIGKAPLLINGLVAVAHVAILREPLELLIEQPETPSLYWALALLPEPFVDLQGAFEAESDVTLRLLPGFDQIDSTSNDPKFWSEQYVRAVEAVRYAAYRYPKPDFSLEGEVLLRSVAWYPQAKQILTDSGMDPSAVEAMPVAKALLLAERMNYVQQTQISACMAAVPWWKLTDEQKSGKTGESTSVTSGLEFASSQVLRASVRTERYLKALQTIEGLRHFAATHDGRLPDSLDEMTETPAPLDPVSGKPFEYRREGNTVFIDGPDLKDGTQFGYEVRFRK